MEQKKLLYLFTGDHPVHRKFAETVNAEIMPLNKDIPKDFDIYFVEGSYAKIVFLKKLRKLNKNAKIIALFADPRMYYLNKRINFDSSQDKITKMGILKSLILRKFLKNVDGAICEGSINLELFSKLNKNAKAVKVIPFVDKNKYKKLTNLNPTLDSETLLFIGNGPDYYCKGLDLLIESFKELKKERKNLKLHILGKGWKVKDSWKAEDINFEGKQDIIKYLNKSVALVHLGRGEGFGIQIMEALLAGIPCIVSQDTGGKDIVDKNFIVSLNKHEITEKIKKYLDMNLTEKKKLSKKIKKKYANLKEEKILKDFKTKFYELIGEIYGKRQN